MATGPEDPAPGGDRAARLTVDVFADVERQYMPSVMAKVRVAAQEIAKADERTEPTYIDVFRAFEATFAGRMTAVPPAAETRHSLLRENLFLVTVSILTILSGLMALAPCFLLTDPTKAGCRPEIFLDMAKLFADVVFGGAAGAAAVASVTRRVTVTASGRQPHVAAMHG
jgi:hypothetical protein